METRRRSTRKITSTPTDSPVIPKSEPNPSRHPPPKIYQKFEEPKSVDRDLRSQYILNQLISRISPAIPASWWFVVARAVAIVLIFTLFHAIFLRWIFNPIFRPDLTVRVLSVPSFYFYFLTKKLFNFSYFLFSAV